MEKERYIDHIAALLCRCATGEADDAANEELEAWGAGSKRAGQILRRVRRGEIPAESIDRFMADANTNVAWQEFRRRATRQHRRRTARLTLRYTAAAAAVVGAVCLGLYRQGDSRHADLPAITSPLSKATLHLPDGATIGLEKGTATDPEILVLHGAKEQGGMLAYDAGADAEADVTVAMHRLSIERGGDFALVLDDGTRVWLNSQTTLTYPNRFAGGERRVEVEGEAYFSVARDGRPFTVHTAGMDVEVTGTEFNVMAYAGAPTVEVTLVEGGVTARTQSEFVELKPAHRVVYLRERGSLAVDPVETALHTSWREGVYEFRAEHLRDIVPQLERWYDVEIVFAEPSIGEMRFTSTVKKANSLNYFMEILKKTQMLDYEVSGKTVTLKKRW
jgi:ferric-dicitrate binding protein FerR (iron transport regulator)